MKIACLNTGHAKWDYDLTTWIKRADNIAKLILDQDIDIILLQEIFLIKYEEADQPLKDFMSTLGLPASDYDKLDILLSKLSNLNKAYSSQPCLIESFDRGIKQAGLYWGLGVVSRLPVTENQMLRLKYTKFDRWPRVLQAVTIRYNDKSIPLYNIHLAAEHITARQRGTLETIKYIQQKDHNKAVWAGDFNDIPTASPAMQCRSIMNDAIDAALSKFLFCDEQEIVFESNLYRACFDGRIDYIFTGFQITVNSLKYLYTTREPFLADHPVIIADIEI